VNIYRFGKFFNLVFMMPKILDFTSSYLDSVLSKEHSKEKLALQF